MPTSHGVWRIAGSAPVLWLLLGLGLACAAVAVVVLSPTSSSVPVGDSVQSSARLPGSPQITATSEGHSDAASLTVTTGGATRGPQLPPPLAQSTGASFYVSVSGSDGNPGTESAPWRSIQKAMNSLTPGQQAYVRAGTYETGETFGTDADTYRWTTECSSSAPCSIVAYPGERPVLHGQVRISGAYLRLSGFVIEGPLSAEVSSCSGRRANQVDISDSHHLEFSHNVVRFSDYHAGLTAYRVHAVQVIANYFHDNGRFTLSKDPCTGAPTTQVDHGIYWGGTNGGDNLIANNLIEHNRAKGLQLYPSTSDVIVTENTIVANGDYGIKVAGTSSDRNTIVNNIVAFNGKKQIRIEVGNGNVVRRNIAYSPNASLAGVANTTGSSVSDNSTADPLFVNRSGGDYRLGAGSPGVDWGLPEWSMGFGYDGGSRPRGAAPDLGAYER
jgi:parallel beta helix pectate lyase-like protein/uncharacterized protein DUF1565